MDQTGSAVHHRSPAQRCCLNTRALPLYGGLKDSIAHVTLLHDCILKPSYECVVPTERLAPAYLNPSVHVEVLQGLELLQ